MVRWLTLLALACTLPLFAGDQILRAVASARHGTLVLWEEGSVRYGGVRSPDGSWTKHELPIDVRDALATSDGEEFVVVHSYEILRLDRNGKPLGEPVSPGYWIYDIVWTGREYLLNTDKDAELAVATLSRDGVLTAPRKVDGGPYQLYASSPLAANENGFYVTFARDNQHNSPPRAPTHLRGRRIGFGLTPLDDNVTLFDTASDLYGWSAAWDGTQFIVAWSGSEGAFVARVSAEGRMSPVQSLSDRWAWGENSIRVHPVDGGVLLEWKGKADSDQPLIAFLRPDGAVTPRLHIQSHGANLTQLISPLPGAKAALVEEVWVDGEKRIQVTVYSRDDMPERPGAPRAEAELQDGTVELRWTAPAQTVTGYVVESSVDGGPWTEAAVLPAGLRSARIARTAKSQALRVRAVNDAGPGAYSDPVTVAGGRRRAVR